jgi:hypothetical protein
MPNNRLDPTSVRLGQDRIHLRRYLQIEEESTIIEPECIHSYFLSLVSLPTVTNLQRRKTAYIKRLKQMRRVRRHAESNNLVLLAVLLEFERVVAIVAVNNEQPVPANSAPLCMLIKVL